MPIDGHDRASSVDKSKLLPDMLESVGRLARSSDRLLSVLEVPYESEALNVIER